MTCFSRRDGGARFTPEGRRLARWMGLAVMAVLVGTAGPARAQAPTVTSVVPANGATGVARDTTLVFTFSLPMDDSIPVIPSVPPFVVGNLEFTPTSVATSFDCNWSDDARELRCDVNGELPASTQVSWKLNPAGTIFPFSSSGGVDAATASGSFTTGTTSGGGGDPGGGGGGGTGAPVVVSTSPANGASDVPVSTTVVFVFDQAMQPNPQLGGFPPIVKGAVAWTGTGVDASKFTYAWSADGKTLTCDYAGDFPGTTQVGWTLNPAGAVVQLLSDEDQTPVATTSGAFTTGAGGSGGGGGDETCDDGEQAPPDWGSYSVSKSSQYVQTSTADPTLMPDSKPTFGTYVAPAQTGPAIPSGSVTIPSGTRKDLVALPFGNALFFSEEFDTDAALDAAYPAGTYTVRFQPTGQAEQAVPMNFPVSGPPTPKVANYTEAQSVNPAQGFLLKWGAFTGAVPATDYIQLTVTDQARIVFMAPNPCIPRELAVTATQIAIPAGYLASGKVYDAELTFSKMFYLSSNAVPKMYGSGVLSRSTRFTINTGGTAPAEAARFVAYRLLPSGLPELTFTGTVGRAYTLLRATAPRGAAWVTAGSAVVDATGKAVFVDPSPGPLPVYYRASNP